MKTYNNIINLWLSIDTYKLSHFCCRNNYVFHHNQNVWLCTHDDMHANPMISYLGKKHYLFHYILWFIFLCQSLIHIYVLVALNAPTYAHRKIVQMAMISYTCDINFIYQANASPLSIFSNHYMTPKLIYLSCSSIMGFFCHEKCPLTGAVIGMILLMLTLKMLQCIVRTELGILKNGVCFVEWHLKWLMGNDYFCTKTCLISQPTLLLLKARIIKCLDIHWHSDDQVQVMIYAWN